MAKLKIPTLHCKHCGHDWMPQQAEVRMCPKCKSPYGGRSKPMAKLKIPTLHCKHCGHDWIPRQAEVRMCPKCKSLSYYVAL